jgi:hypothetical protein
MERVILPFAISEDTETGAVSTTRFTVQRNQTNFRSVTISGLKFMRLYEQANYSTFQYPFNQSWDEHNDFLKEERANISQGSITRNDLHFGHARAPELKALDEMPHIIEFDFDLPGTYGARNSINKNPQLQYQTISTIESLKDDVTKIQILLVYSPDLTRGEYGGWEGSIACNMQNLGTIPLDNRGMANEFEVNVRMFNFKMEVMNTVPSVQLDLLFR